ncbi:hypothetical protein SM124_20835 [Bacillus sp. 31A1R]|uniref:XRE family transcriptional regulator n=1 Tax=Robertmurraya mangrovi TaxID=3098077 RepID=A0ABU5J431_9BACI|nr:hypothetical protein [Bacillus sp. 31A1R]MDZ5474153.1 hypothetical protein [Bacillus sp. 31A1R]
MSEEALRQSLNAYLIKYGSTISFIASNVGVSREHLSRWMHNEDYLISKELKNRLVQFVSIL